MELIGTTLMLTLVGLGLFLMAWGFASRKRRKARARAADPVPEVSGEEPGFDPVARRVEGRMAAIEAVQANLAARLEGSGAEDRLQAMAAQLLGLVRDKNATLETALAGLDQLRARMRTLEQMGSAAEARGLFEGLTGRLDALESAQSAAAAALEAGLAARREREEGTPDPQVALVEQLTRLHAQKDTAIGTVIGRLGPLETRLAAIESDLGGRKPAAAEAAQNLARLESRLEARIEAVQAAQGTAAAALAALEAAGSGPVAEIAQNLARLHAQKDAMVESLLARITVLETELAARDPKAVLDGFAGRLDALQARLGILETPGENPFAEISDQLTRLYAQKDAAVETVLARLAPLEAQLGELQAALAARDPKAVLDGFAARLDAVQSRLGILETPGENPFAEISAQLTRLYAQKDAAVETVLARLGPLEAQFGELQAALAARDPEAVLDGFAGRLDALQARLGILETPGENPFAEISDQLTRLYAQKDAAVETVLARLAPLEARLAEIEARDPRAALDGFALRLDTLQSRLGTLETPGENPFAEISAQLTQLYAQKDATVETVFARLAPVEARFAEIEARDPRGALDGFAARLDALQARLDAPGENPFAGVSEQLTRLYAQKDATVETVFARLAPLEAQLAELQALAAQAAALATSAAAADPRAALDDFAVRLETLHWTQGEVAAGLAALRAVIGDGSVAQPFAAIAEQLTQLHAQKDAALAAVEARLAAMDARIDARVGDPGDAEEAARSEARAIAEELAQLRATAAQTELFADRLAVLEASLPRLNAAQSQMMRVLERQAGGSALPAALTDPLAAAPTAAGTAPAPEPAADPFAAFRDLPRVVSLHHK